MNHSPEPMIIIVGACTNALIQFFFSLINGLITYVGSKELEKSGPDSKESSSTHTSSSSSLLHKRKTHAYYGKKKKFLHVVN